MRHLFKILATLALATSAFPTIAHAQGDFCEVAAQGGSAGSVERIREVPVTRDLHAFDPEVLDHHVQPEMADEVIIRLDSGPLIAFTQQAPKGEPQRLQAGQRVRILLSGSIARVEPERCAAIFSSLESN